MLIAPLLHAATLLDQHIGTVLRWLDTRDFAPAEERLEQAKAYAAAAQLRGVLARDPRNRESTLMSATNLLRAYRYPNVAQNTSDELTPAAFLDGEANTIYIVAAAHHQEDLQPIILALLCSIYEAAIDASRKHGPLNPPLRLLLDEAAHRPGQRPRTLALPSAVTTASRSRPAGNPSPKSRSATGNQDATPSSLRPPLKSSSHPWRTPPPLATSASYSAKSPSHISPTHPNTNPSASATLVEAKTKSPPLPQTSTSPAPKKPTAPPNVPSQLPNGSAKPNPAKPSSSTATSHQPSPTHHAGSKTRDTRHMPPR